MKKLFYVLLCVACVSLVASCKSDEEKAAEAAAELMNQAAGMYDEAAASYGSYGSESYGSESYGYDYDEDDYASDAYDAVSDAYDYASDAYDAVSDYASNYDDDDLYEAAEAAGAALKVAGKAAKYAADDDIDYEEAAELAGETLNAYGAALDAYGSSIW
jgi:hypothetical protein